LPRQERSSRDKVHSREVVYSSWNPLGTEKLLDTSLTHRFAVVTDCNENFPKAANRPFPSVPIGPVKYVLELKLLQHLIEKVETISADDFA
jgi:hypothetical protein